MAYFYVYDTKEKRTCGHGNEIRCNAERKAQRANIMNCGIEETERPEEERRFIVVEI
ncbi:MAG: hypothetical protein MRZ75_08520 [Roseburia sp.]|nr:hypothetical protein [Roseburia sp.]